MSASSYQTRCVGISSRSSLPQTSTPSGPSGAMALDLSPLILMSGHLTKRTGNPARRWQRRWWQLLGDGTLIYFRGEERLKVLGEIDIAHTCYDVRLANKCGVTFPSAVPPSCCFAISVLKRTYYFFAPSSQEVLKWMEAFKGASFLLNRTRSRSLEDSPAVQVATEAFNQPPPPPITNPPAPRPPHPLPPNDSTTEEEDEPSGLPSFEMPHVSYRMRSVPDLRYTPNASWIDGSPRVPAHRHAPSSREHRRVTTSSLDITPSSYRRDDRSRDQSNWSHKGHNLMNKRTSSVGSKYHQSQGNLAGQDREVWLNSSTLPSSSRLAHMKKQQWKSEMDTTWTPNYNRLEELYEQEREIKKKLEHLRQKEKLQAVSSPGRGIPVLPTPISRHASFSQPSETSHFESLSQVAPDGEYENIRQRKQPPKKLPKPIKRKKTPYNLSYDDTEYQEEEKVVHIRGLSSSQDAPPPSPRKRSYTSPSVSWNPEVVERRMSSAQRAEEASQWAQIEVKKVWVWD